MFIRCFSLARQYSPGQVRVQNAKSVKFNVKGGRYRSFPVIFPFNLSYFYVIDGKHDSLPTANNSMNHNSKRSWKTLFQYEFLLAMRLVFSEKKNQNTVCPQKRRLSLFPSLSYYKGCNWRFWFDNYFCTPSYSGKHLLTVLYSQITHYVCFDS